MLSRKVNGLAIRETRERLGLGVNDVIAAVAERGVKVSRQHLYSVETGSYQPSAKLFVALVKALDCDQELLLLPREDAA